MASKAKYKLTAIVLNNGEIGKFMKSEEMTKMLHERAEQIANRAGTGYAADTKMMGTRVIASAYTDSFDAMRDNLDNNSLLRAVDYYKIK